MNEPPPFSWRPGIGDPTVMGWLTVAAYFTTAIFCLVTAAKDPQRDRRWWWRLLCALLFGLGFNKQLDLQSAMTEVGRYLAFRQGWYDDRRTVQYVFLATVSLLSLSFVAVLARRLWRHLRVTGPSLLGLGVTVGFVLLRASSFHGMDGLIGFEPVPGIRMNWILELGGIGLIALGVGWGWTARSSPPVPDLRDAPLPAEASTRARLDPEEEDTDPGGGPGS